MKVVHKESGFILGKNIEHATSAYSRMLGLMFRKEMGNIDGMMLEPCNSIHNFFVRFPIDVIFLSKENKIIKIIRGFKPWQVSWIYFSSRKVLELPVNTIPEQVVEGDYLEVRDV